MYELPEFTITLKNKTKADERLRVMTSLDVADVARRCFDDGTISWIESFVAIALNRKNQVLGFYRVSQGGLTATIADPRVIMQFALLSNATSLIVAHNHPSGNLSPSPADRSQTEKLKTALSYFDIKLVDHVIVAEEGHFSFADEGLI